MQPIRENTNNAQSQQEQNKLNMCGQPLNPKGKQLVGSKDQVSNKPNKLVELLAKIQQKHNKQNNLYRKWSKKQRSILYVVERKPVSYHTELIQNNVTSSHQHNPFSSKALLPKETQFIQIIDSSTLAPHNQESISINNSSLNMNGQIMMSDQSVTNKSSESNENGQMTVNDQSLMDKRLQAQIKLLSFNKNENLHYTEQEVIDRNKAQSQASKLRQSKQLCESVLDELKQIQKESQQQAQNTQSIKQSSIDFPKRKLIKQSELPLQKIDEKQQLSGISKQVQDEEIEHQSCQQLSESRQQGHLNDQQGAEEQINQQNQHTLSFTFQSKSHQSKETNTELKTSLNQQQAKQRNDSDDSNSSESLDNFKDDYNYQFRQHRPFKKAFRAYYSMIEIPISNSQQGSYSSLRKQKVYNRNVYISSSKSQIAVIEESNNQMQILSSQLTNNSNSSNDRISSQLSWTISNFETPQKGESPQALLTRKLNEHSQILCDEKNRQSSFINAQYFLSLIKSTFKWLF